MDNPLGQKSEFPTQYAPEVLYRVPRNRADFGSTVFRGADRWVCYEVSWLNADGTPQAGIGTLAVPAHSTFLVESKSLKLYLGSFSFESFESPQGLANRIQSDLSTLLECGELSFECAPLVANSLGEIATARGDCIDHLSAPTTATTTPSPSLLRCAEGMVTEALHSNLFRSLCPVTAQPDFATVEIVYSGSPITPQSLLQYLCSFRNAAGFHEHCCEQIFHDLTKHCNPRELVVSCYFTRRGGIEINPYRTSAVTTSLGALPTSRRMLRQ